MVSRRNVLKYGILAGVSLLSLGAIPWRHHYKINKQAQRMRRLQFSGYDLCIAQLRGEPTSALRKRHELAYKDLMLNNNPIDIGTLENPAPEEEIAQNFLDKYVYCRWDRPINNRPLGRIMKENQVKNVYLGRKLKSVQSIQFCTM